MPVNHSDADPALLLFMIGLFSIVAVLLSGCALTPAQKRWAGVAAGVVIVGAIAVHKADKDSQGPDKSIGKPQCSGGDFRVCR